MLGRTWPIWGETSLIHSLRSRRALLLAGGCCSSLLAAGLPTEALAQTTDQPATQQAQATTPAPGDVNAPQPAAAPGDLNAQPPQGAIVITGFRQSLQNSINIK